MDPISSHSHELAHVQDLPIRTIALVIALSAVGGLAHFFDRARKNDFNTHWFIELLGDVTYSLASGFSVWFISVGSGASDYISAALAIVAGHLGARLIFAIQNTITTRILGIISNDVYRVVKDEEGKENAKQEAERCSSGEEAGTGEHLTKPTDLPKNQ